jgi:hypothetical protein
MCVFKNHAFIYFLRPPSWSGTILICSPWWTGPPGRQKWCLSLAPVFVMCGSLLLRLDQQNGVPDQITSDRGAQFTSGVWASLCARLEIKHLLTSAYHPQANSLFSTGSSKMRWERGWLGCSGFSLASERSLRRTLMCPPRSWYTVSHSHSLGNFSAEASSQEILDRIRSSVMSFNPLPVREPSHQSGAASTLEALQQATHVYVLIGGVIPSLAPGYQGPYLVLQKGPKCFRIAVEASEETISVDRLKPHYGTWAEVVKRGCGQPQ